MPDPVTDQPQGELQPIQSGGIGVQANAEDMGGNIARATWQAGEVAQRAYNEANQAGVEQFHNQQMQWETQHLHDPQGGILYQNTGLGAPKAVDQTMENYQQFVGKATATMNHDQVRMAQPYIDQHQGQLQDQLLKYEHEQVTNAHVGIMDQGITLHANAMIQHADDPQAVDGHIQAMQALGSDTGRMLGWDQGRIDQFNQQQVSKASYGMIRQLVASGKDQQAQAWLQAHPDAIQGPERTEVTQMVDNASTAGTALRDLHKYTLDDKGQPLPWSDTVNRLYSDQTLQANPKQFAATLEAAEKWHGLKDQAFREQQEGLKQQAVGILTDPANTAGSNSPAYQAMRMQLEPTTRAQMDALGIRDESAKDNPAFVNDIYSRLATKQGQQSLKDVDIIGAVGRGDLTLKTAKELAGDNFKGGIIGAAMSEGATNPKVASIMSQQDVLAETFKARNIDPTKQPAEANDIRQELSQWSEAQEAQGRKVTPDDQRKHVQDYARLQVSIPGTFSSTNTPAALVKPEDIAKYTRPDLDNAPPAFRRALDDNTKFLVKVRGLDPESVSPTFLPLIQAQSILYVAAQERGDAAMAAQVRGNIDEAFTQEQQAASERAENVRQQQAKAQQRAAVAAGAQQNARMNQARRDAQTQSRNAGVTRHFATTSETLHNLFDAPPDTSIRPGDRPGDPGHTEVQE